MCRITSCFIYMRSTKKTSYMEEQIAYALKKVATRTSV